MANNLFQVKRTSVSGRTPNTTDPSNSQYIAAGELALNMPDGILYTSNGSTLLPVGANNVNINVTGNATINAIIANGSIGSPGQVLSSNGSGLYWVSAGGTGTVTSVGSANGIAGGPITSTGTLYAVAGNNTVFVNASGIHVNTDALPVGVNVNAEYVWTNTHTFNQTINGTANNATNLGGVAAANYVNTSGNYTLSGNITLGGTNTVISSNLNVTGSFVNIASATVANSSGVYTTGTVNATSYTVGALFTANSTLVNTAAINVTGRTNTATFFATTSANVGANVTVNTSTIFVGNTTANLLANSVYITVANSTTNVQITPIDIGIGANVTVNTSLVFVGNSTVNVSLRSSNLVLFSANPATGDTANVNIGVSPTSGTIRIQTNDVNSNAFINATSFNYGNSTVNSAFQLTQVRFSDTSANSGLNSSRLFIGNSTVNTFSNSSYISVANSTGNVIITPGTQSINATGTVNAASIRIGATFTVNSTQANISSIPLSANGSNGTSGQILASNGNVGSPYWTAPVGAGYYKGGSATVGSLAVQGQNIFRVNANTLNYDTTIATGENAQATGPLSVNTGITLTISAGARVSII